MPRYNYSGGPADWASQQQNRRDDQVRTILNLMMTMKQNQTEQGWKQKEWESGLAADEFNRSQQERRTAASELSATSLAGQRAEEDPMIQQARIFVETGQAKNLGEGLRMAKGIRTVDEDVARTIAIEKAKAKAGLGSENKPNAQFDESLNLQKQLGELANDLESQLGGFKKAKQDAAKGYMDDDAVARVSQMDKDIADTTKRLNKARSLAVRLKPGKMPDAKLGMEIVEFLGGGAQTPPPPSMGDIPIAWPMAVPRQGAIPPPPPGFNIIK